MDPANIPGTDKIAEIIRFWVSFGTDPRRALGLYQGLGDVNLQLLLTLGIALGTSTFILWVLSRMGWEAAPGVTKAIFGPIAPRIASLPAPALLPAVVLWVFAATVVLHGAAVSWVYVDRRIHLLDSNLGGSFFHSLNAAVAFLAFFVPLCTVCAVAAGAVSRAAPERADLAANIAGAGLGIIAIVYYPWAMAAAHPNTTYTEALMALTGWLLALCVLAVVLTVCMRIVRPGIRR